VIATVCLLGGAFISWGYVVPANVVITKRMHVGIFASAFVGAAVLGSIAYPLTLALGARWGALLFWLTWIPTLALLLYSIRRDQLSTRATGCLRTPGMEGSL
jgi:hypothetical protein